MIKNFIMKSNKIYVILGVGIVACLLVLTANISYTIGKEQAGYSEEYLKTYAILIANYHSTFPEESIENALNLAETNCFYFRDTVESGRYLKWLK